MEFVFVGAVLNTLLPKLWEKRQETNKMKAAIRMDVHFIDQELRQVEALLEDCKFNTGSATVTVLKRQARELSQDTRDCILRFSNNENASSTDFAQQISRFRIQVKDACRSLRQHCTSSTGTTPEKPEDLHADYAPGDLPVGMSGARDELLQLVQLPSRQSEGTPKVKPKVISIVGFGGLGKTLLAKLVYDHFGPAHECRARVTAAAKPAKEVLKKILDQVDPAGKHENLDLDNIRQQLAACLRKNKFFIVIDDIQSICQWDSMNCAFPKDVEGTIIVTTTIKSVANSCSSSEGYVYKLSPLDKDKSLDLFLKDSGFWDPHLTEVNASDILNKCDGLPLAIVSMSQILRGKEEGPTSDACRDALKQLGVYLLEEKCVLKRLRWVLMNTYTGLTGYAVRSCLLYYCLYKHNMDAVPRRNSLIRQWEAEGFLAGKSGISNMDVAVENLKTLIDHNIIQSMEVSTNGTTKKSRPCGMIAEYISHISLAENFATLVSDLVETPTNRIRRLAFHEDSATDDRIISAMDLKIVLTLAVSGNGCEAIMNFRKYELLGVLDLKECTNLKYRQVEEDICKLVFLKYLSLGKTIEKIPRRIRRLELLETLDMMTTNPVKVFTEVFWLPNLKHLLGNFELQDKVNEDLQSFLKKKSSLETISGFVTDNINGFPQLMFQMKRLRRLKICCGSKTSDSNLQGLSKVIKDFTRTEMSSKDHSLSIDCTTCTSLPEQFLRHLGSLSSLKLRGDLRPFQLSLGPGGIQHFIQLSGIKKLRLSHTYLSGEAVLAGLANLVALEYLKLEEQELRPLKIKSGTFKGLIRLCLVSVETLNGITIEPEGLPNLVSLHLICKTLDRGLESLIGLGFPRRIKEIALHSGLHPDIKNDWKTAARGHPNRPDVLLIQNGAPIRKA